MSTTFNNQHLAIAPILSLVEAQLKAIELHALIKKVLISEEWPRGRAGDLKRAHEEVKAAVDALEPFLPLLREAATCVFSGANP